jgi:hypothetical protein
MGPEDLEWLDIEDFSPGIHQSLYEFSRGPHGQPAPDGSCTTNTWGCVADSNGGLRGGPKLVSIYSFNAQFRILNDDTPDGISQPPLEEIRLIDFTVIRAEWMFPGEGFSSYDETPYRPDVPTMPADGHWKNYRRKQVPSIGSTLNRGDASPGYLLGILMQGHQPKVDPYMGWVGSNLILLGISPQKTPSGPINTMRVHTERFYWSMEYRFPHQNQRQFGWGDVDWGLQYGPAETDENYPSYKVGVPALVASYCHFPEGQSSLMYALPSPTNLAPTGGGLAVVTDMHKDVKTQTGAVGGGFWQGGIMPTHMVLHANRAVTVGVPVSDAAWDEDGNRWLHQSDANPWEAGHAMINHSTNPYAFEIDDENTGFGWSILQNNKLHFSAPGHYPLAETGITTGKYLQNIDLGGHTKINAIVSMAATKLFVLSTHRGAAIVEGDITLPAINRLPGVESTYGLTPRPVAIDNGVVYGSKSGIFMWQGEQSSQSISSQLHGQFWVAKGLGQEDGFIQEEGRVGSDYMESTTRGRLAYKSPYVYAPNGYFTDLDAGGWWRFGHHYDMENNNNTHDTFNYTHYQPDDDGYIWATRHIHDGVSMTPFSETEEIESSTRGLGRTFEMDGRIADTTNWPMARMDPERCENRWVWEGQPLTISRNRTITIRELSLILQCSDIDGVAGSEVEIRIIANGEVAHIHKVTGSNLQDQPRTVSIPLEVTGMNLQIKIMARGALPKTEIVLHRLSIGWRSAERIRMDI